MEKEWPFEAKTYTVYCESEGMRLLAASAAAAAKEGGVASAATKTKVSSPLPSPSPSSWLQRIFRVVVAMSFASISAWIFAAQKYNEYYGVSTNGAVATRKKNNSTSNFDRLGSDLEEDNVSTVAADDNIKSVSNRSVPLASFQEHAVVVIDAHDDGGGMVQPSLDAGVVADDCQQGALLGGENKTSGADAAAALEELLRNPPSLAIVVRCDTICFFAFIRRFGSSLSQYSFSPCFAFLFLLRSFCS